MVYIEYSLFAQGKGGNAVVITLSQPRPSPCHSECDSAPAGPSPHTASGLARHLGTLRSTMSFSFRTELVVQKGSPSLALLRLHNDDFHLFPRFRTIDAFQRPRDERPPGDRPKGVGRRDVGVHEVGVVDRRVPSGPVPDCLHNVCRRLLGHLSHLQPRCSGSSMASAMSRKRFRKKKDMLIIPGSAS